MATGHAPTVGAEPVRQVREERAVAVFGTWMITGLFIDGWAHGAEKPETFFSPWHGILYSGFVAALLWHAWDGRRPRPGTEPTTGLDRLTTVGLVVFVTGAVGDGLWHEIFGIEVDLEALVSPSHLALFIGGFLMVSGPLRVAREAASDRRTDPAPSPTWAAWWAQGVTLMLATALVGFFCQYLSPFEGIAATRPADPDVRELREIVEVSSILVFNALLVGALLFGLRWWRPPFGSTTLLTTGVVLGMVVLEGFEQVELILPAIAAGLVADVLIARRAPSTAVAAATSVVLWSGVFVAAELTYGLEWPAELWAGSLVLATTSSLLLASLFRERRPLATEVRPA